MGLFTDLTLAPWSDLSRNTINRHPEHYYLSAYDVRGSLVLVCSVPEHAKAQLYEAGIYTRHSFQREADTLMARNDIDAGATGPVPAWGELRESLNSQVVARLGMLGVSAPILASLMDRLNFEKNLERLEETAVIQFGVRASEVMDAVELGKDAHAGQTTKRTIDIAGPVHIPYLNHTICASLDAMELGLSLQVAKALICHDVVEESPITRDEVEQRLGKRSADIVDACTKPKEMPREVFMAHVKALKGEEAAAKALDRLDNNYRAFLIMAFDSEGVAGGYIRRLLNENREVYQALFDREPLLAGKRRDFMRTDAEIRRLCEIKYGSVV